jgi:hypothetical protein
MATRRAWLVLWGVIALWFGAAATGMFLLWRYKATPGETASAPGRWPEASIIKRSSGKPTLVMLAHPHCPCTRASMEELAALMTRFHDKVDAYVLFLKPEGVDEGWDKTGLWDRAGQIAGVTPVRDQGGAEAARFGAKVSGQTVLYAADGRLLYSGGITGSRGHVGDNVGTRRIASLIDSGTADRASGPVYGCSLEDPETQGAPGGPP